MIRKVLVSIDEDVLSKFDNHIGLIKRSTAINQLMKQEINNKGSEIIG